MHTEWMSWMKKGFFCLLVVISTLLFPLEGAALDRSRLGSDGFESLPLSEDFQEISATMPELLERVNGLIEFEIPGSSIQITEDDIHWEKAFKIYIDTDVYSTETNSPSQVIELLRQADTQHNVIWQLPISKGDVHLTVDYTIQRPLPDSARSMMLEADFDQVMNQVGKWHTTGVSFLDTDKDYKRVFLAALGTEGTEDGSTKFILGSFSKMCSVVGVTMNDETMGNVVPIEEPRIMNNEYVDPNRRSAQAIQRGQVYDFRQIAAKMASVHPRETDALGGGGGGSPDAVLTHCPDLRDGVPRRCRWSPVEVPQSPINTVGLGIAPTGGCLYGMVTVDGPWSSIFNEKKPPLKQVGDSDCQKTRMKRRNKKIRRHVRRIFLYLENYSQSERFKRRLMEMM